MRSTLILSKPNCRRRLNQIAGLFIRLNAMHGLLDFFLKILHAHAQAVETHPAHGFQMFTSSDPGIDFDADLGVGRKRESFARETEKVFNLFGGKIGGCSAAPVELRHLAIARNAAGDVSRFFFQDVEVRRRAALIFANDHVASAKQAEAFTEGKMHVQRNRGVLLVGQGDCGFVLIGAERIGPDRSGRIAGIARSGPVVAIDEFLVDGKLLAHFPQRRVDDGHGANLLRAQERDCATWLALLSAACWPVWMNN